MNIDQYLAFEDKFKPKTMRKWISRSKNLFQDIPIRVYFKTKDTDLLYCQTCGAMPDRAFGTDDPSDQMQCEKCFKNNHSSDEFFL